MKSKIDNALAALKSQGYSVKPFEREGTIWYEIDGWKLASRKDMEELADRVWALLELGGNCLSIG